MLKPVYLPEEHSDFLWVVLGSPWGLLAIWLIAINLVTFFVFGIDKWKAKRTLFLLAALGGSAGALLGMRVFHHKTLHKTFRFGIPAILALQIILPLGLWMYFALN